VKSTGVKDKNGCEIFVGHKFRWKLPAGLRVAYPVKGFYTITEYLNGAPDYRVATNYEELSEVIEQDGEFLLREIGGDRMLSRLLGEFPDGTFRYQYGEVVS